MFVTEDDSSLNSVRKKGVVLESIYIANFCEQINSFLIWNASKYIIQNSAELNK